jgi:hypothetical protein
MQHSMAQYPFLFSREQGAIARHAACILSIPAGADEFARHKLACFANRRIGSSARGARDYEFSFRFLFEYL